MDKKITTIILVMIIAALMFAFAMSYLIEHTLQFGRSSILYATWAGVSAILFVLALNALLDRWGEQSPLAKPFVYFTGLIITTVILLVALFILDEFGVKIQINSVRFIGVCIVGGFICSATVALLTHLHDAMKKKDEPLPDDVIG